MSYFKIGPKLGFYLQDYYVKDWVDNSMLFWEVADIEACHQSLVRKNLPVRFENVRLSAIKGEDWGREFLLHDPSSVLWHIGGVLLIGSVSEVHQAFIAIMFIASNNKLNINSTK